LRRVRCDPEVSLFALAGEYPVPLMTGELSVSYPVGSPEWVCRYIWCRYHMELRVWQLLQVDALINQVEGQGPLDDLGIDDRLASGVEGLSQEERDLLLRGELARISRGVYEVENGQVKFLVPREPRFWFGPDSDDSASSGGGMDEVDV
jgi:hypothetical protein